MSINWNKIKTEYVSTDTSFDKMVEKYNVSRTAVEHRAKKEKWVEERRQYKDKLGIKIIEDGTDNEIKAIKKMKAKERQQFDKMETLIWRAISERKKDENGELLDGYVEKRGLNPLDVDRFMSAQLKLQTMKYRNYGIADKHELGGMGGGAIPVNISDWKTKLKEKLNDNSD